MYRKALELQDTDTLLTQEDVDLKVRSRLRSMGRWAARGVVVLCFAFAGFQVALALGAPYGEMAWGGSSAVLPSGMRAASAGAAIYLSLAAAAMLVRSGDLGRDLPPAPFRWFNRFLALQLALNTAGNLAARDAGERSIMAAASALGALLCLCALIPPRPLRSDHLYR